MFNKKFNIKKASFNYTLIILFFVLIFSAGAIFYFLSQVYEPGESSKEICHNSIVARSSATLGDLQFRDKLSLNCVTERVCLTSGSKDACKESLGENSEESPIKVLKIKEEKDILEALSEILYEDHNMVGKGLLNPMPREFFRLKKTNYCMITSRISLDPKLKETFGKIDGVELYDYMYNKKNSEGKSYLELIYGSNYEHKDYTIDLNNYDYISTEIFASNSYLSEIGLGTSTAVVTAVSLSWLTGGASLGILVFSGVAGAGVTYKSLDDPNSDKSYTYLPPTLNPYNAQYIREKLECDYIETISY